MLKNLTISVFLLFFGSIESSEVTLYIERTPLLDYGLGFQTREQEVKINFDDVYNIQVICNILQDLKMSDIKSIIFPENQILFYDRVTIGLSVI